METILPPCSTGQEGPKTTTNLYELIAALQNEAGPENDDLVVATVVDLLRSQRIRFLRHIGTNRCN